VPRGAGRALVADERDVGDVVVVDAGAPAGGVVVAPIEAEVLLEVRLRLGPLQDDGVDGRLQELRVRDVRPGDGDRQGAALGLD